MNLLPRMVVLALLVLNLGTVRAEPAERERTQDAFAEGLEAYESGHWRKAFETFATLADRGHPQAARIALLMRRHGRDLYRETFAAGPQQLRRWAWHAACQRVQPESACQPIGQAP